MIAVSRKTLLVFVLVVVIGSSLLFATKYSKSFETVRLVGGYVCILVYPQPGGSHTL